MKAFFKYTGSDPNKASVEEEMTQAQEAYLTGLEARGVNEFVLPNDGVLATFSRDGDRFVIVGRDIEVAP